MQTELARFTKQVVTVAQKVVAGRSAPDVNKGETGYADWVIVSIHALREYLDQLYRRLMEILYEMPRISRRHILHRIERDGFEAVRDEFLVYAPHFHVLGLSKYVTGEDMTEHLEDRSGWVVKRRADDDGVSLGDLEALAAATTYSVSHAGVRETGRGMDAAYRYFGTVANFQPKEHVRERAYAAVAAVSETVLGVEPRGSRCGERVQVPAVDADHQERVRELAAEAAGNSSTGGGSAGSGGGGSKVEIETCGGRLRSMAGAPERLRDREWMNRARHAAELPAAYREFLLIEEQRDREHLGGGPPPPPSP